MMYNTVLVDDSSVLLTVRVLLLSPNKPLQYVNKHLYIDYVGIQTIQLIDVQTHHTVATYLYI